MMNKEDFINWIDRPPSNTDLDLINYIVGLQQRIDKAIEYINKLKEYPYLERYYVGELLEILGGKE